MSFLDTFFEHLHQDDETHVVGEVHGEAVVGITRWEMRALITTARATLGQRGVKPGDRVALVAPNSGRWVAADLSVLAQGAIVVPMYARQDPAELVEMIEDCEPVVVLVATETLGEALADAGCGVPMVSFATLFADAGEASDPPLHAWADGDVVTIIYTSGTSGVPKGVMLTAANVAHMLPVTADALVAMMGERAEPDRVFHYLPFCFAGSRVVLWTCLLRGNPIHVSTDLDNLGQELATVSPHYLLNVPMLLERIRGKVEAGIRQRPAPIQSLYRRARDAYARLARGEGRWGDTLAVDLGKRILFSKIKQKVGPDLECLICGSAPLGADTQRWFEMLGIPVYQVYGLTETTAIVTMDEPPDVVAGRVGRAIAGVETRVSDEGELLVRGPNVFAGYWKRPEATEAAFEDGWFRTGDQVEEEEASFRIVGRAKNLLVLSSGHNVAPEPIEQKILGNIEGVEQAVVVGHGRSALGVLIVGDVSPEHAEAGLDELNEGLPHYRKVRRYHHVEEPFSIENGLLTANRKLRRAVIEARHSDSIEAMYT
jgi:long-chain acyl-CoA synthetase